MVRLLIRTAVFLAAPALGLAVAALLLPGVRLTWQGFVLVVVIFALVQSLLAPVITKVAARRARAFLGGVGLISTFVALVLASWIADGLVITGVVTWLLATVIVWLITALATVLLPAVFLRERSATPARVGQAGDGAR